MTSERHSILHSQKYPYILHVSTHPKDRNFDTFYSTTSRFRDARLLKVGNASNDIRTTLNSNRLVCGLVSFFVTMEPYGRNIFNDISSESPSKLHTHTPPKKIMNTPLGRISTKVDSCDVQCKLYGIEREIIKCARS